MSVFTCIIVDDNEIDQLTLLSCLKKYPQFKILGVYSSPEKALAVINEIEVDVLFLDIQMPGITGIELRKRAETVPACIFISFSHDFAVESYETETLDYIVKPLKPERFAKTVQRIETFMELRRGNKGLPDTGSDPDTFYIKDGTELVKVKMSEILYLEALKDYTLIVTPAGKYSVFASISSMLERKVFHSFIRIHRSYAVHRDKIQRIASRELMLEDGSVVPVGRAFRDNLSQLL